MSDPRRPDHRPVLMIASDTSDENLNRLKRNFTCHLARTGEEHFALARERGAEIDGVVVNGTTPVPAALMDLLPNLSIVAAQGVGYEGIDLPAARERGLAVTHGPGANADCVADHVMTLMLAVLRDVPRLDATVRRGEWRDWENLRPMPTGRKVGVLGLGAIGKLVARRCLGFDMTVAYHNRRPVRDCEHRYFDSILGLAEFSDILVVLLPGGDETRHRVDREVIRALGPEGVLISMGRGSVVDTEGLLQALEEKAILGAGLDVYEGEPDIDPRLRTQPRAVLSPHIGGLSPESVRRANLMLIENLRAHFEGRTPPNPVP